MQSLSRPAQENFITAKEYRHAEARLAVLRMGWREVMSSDKVRDAAEMLPDAYGIWVMEALQLTAALGLMV